MTAFREPRYDGALEYAPALIGDVRTGLDRLRTLREEMVRIGRNLDRAYAALASPVGEIDGNGTVRVLHISDLHLNPAGFDLAERLADQFDVAAVVDTGDMGTWGLPREPQVAANIGRFEVPYLFVKGNHDDADMVKAVAANDNARVLDGAGTEVAGIRFYGVADPTFTPGKGQPGGGVRGPQGGPERRRGRRHRPPGPAARTCSWSTTAGWPPTPAATCATVLDGHLHRFGTEVVNGTRTLQTGTAGRRRPRQLPGPGPAPGRRPGHLLRPPDPPAGGRRPHLRPPPRLLLLGRAAPAPRGRHPVRPRPPRGPPGPASRPPAPRAAETLSLIAPVE